jgi:predicted DNA-binding protein (MmcQ/YjbR family)
MIGIKVFRELALSFPGTSEQLHFEQTSFRAGKKIFATYDAKNNRACIRLSPIDQNVFTAFDKTIIYPVPNKWGLQGWTLIEMKLVKKGMFKDALTTAYNEVTKGRGGK